MSPKDLKQKTLTGFKWSFLDQFGKAGGQFIIGIILTRLLSPADFGLVGMIIIFIVIGQSLTNSGFGQALIQKKDADKTDFSTVFYFNIFASTAIYALIFIFSPLIADFYSQPKLISITKIICLSFVIGAFGLIHSIHLEKSLNFKAPSIVGLLSELLAGIVSITMAYKGFGVWALVAQTLLRSIISTTLLWKLSKWRPTLEFSWTSLKSMFSFGSKILITGLVQSIFQNIYYMIIGRLFPASTLGYYVRASQFKKMPVNTISTMVKKVTFPVFSTIQDDHDKLISGYTKSIRWLVAVTIPIMVFIFIASRPLIHIVLGEQWLPVVPYLKVMCLYGWLFVVFTMNNQVIIVKGRSDYYLNIQIIDKVFIVVSILVTFKFGIIALIYGHMVATVLSFLVSGFYLNKVIDISIKFQIKQIMPFFIASALMLLSSLPLSSYISNEIVYLLSSTSLAAIVYISILWLMKVGELRMGIDLTKKYYRDFFSKSN